MDSKLKGGGVDGGGERRTARVGGGVDGDQLGSGYQTREAMMSICFLGVWRMIGEIAR